MVSWLKLKQNPLAPSQVRKLEFFIAFLVLTIAACFFVELHYAKPDSKEVLKGLFIPQLKGSGATGLAISLLGAMVMPYVFTESLWILPWLNFFCCLLTTVAAVHLLQPQPLSPLCFGSLKENTAICPRHQSNHFISID